MPAGAAAVVAVTSANSARIRREQCAAIIHNYKPDVASVRDMQTYAGCVRTIYGSGQPLSPEAVIGLKVVFVIVFLVAVFGAFKAFADQRSLGDACFGFVFGAFGSALFIAVVTGVIAGFRWVLLS